MILSCISAAGRTWRWIYPQLKKLTEELPDSHTFLHADFHLKNIMIVKDELMLIDMETICAGDPIFEMATMYNS